MTEIDAVYFLLDKMNKGIITSEEYKVLQYFLIKNSQVFESNYPVCTTSINDDRVLFISDTHIGSEYESHYFMFNAYNFAINNNIRTVIHLGDLIEGTVRENRRTLSYENAKAELERAINYVCYYGIETKLLLGNHDFSIVNKFSYPSFPKLVDNYFTTNKLFSVLGLGRVVLNWNGVKIILSHKISEKLLNYEKGEIVSDFELLGHAHWYYMSENKNAISVPSLSNELKDKTYYDSISFQKYGYSLERNKPYLNFLIARFVDDGVILFEEYVERDGKIVINEEVVFDKNSAILRKK